MKEINIDVIATTKMGCVIETTITLPEDYGMGQLVRSLRGEGYTSFMTAGMKKFAKIADM